MIDDLMQVYGWQSCISRLLPLPAPLHASHILRVMPSSTYASFHPSFSPHGGVAFVRFVLCATVVPRALPRRGGIYCRYIYIYIREGEGGGKRKSPVLGWSLETSLLCRPLEPLHAA